MQYLKKGNNYFLSIYFILFIYFCSQIVLFVLFKQIRPCLEGFGLKSAVITSKNSTLLLLFLAPLPLMETGQKRGKWVQEMTQTRVPTEHVYCPPTST